MEIKPEWIAKAHEVYCAEDGYEDFASRFRAALAAVAPLIRAEERERMNAAFRAEIANQKRVWLTHGYKEKEAAVKALQDLDTVIRSRGESHD